MFNDAKTRSGKHVAGYRHPRVGEPRRQRKPLCIDRVPKEVKDAIVAARDAGQTWREIAQAASQQAGQSLSLKATARWFDIRVAQVRRETPELGELLRAVRELTALLKTDIERRANR